MGYKSLLSATMLCAALNVSGKPHLHGSGTLFIAQDNNLWQLQFVLPASDVVGFEHKPENSLQAKKALSQSEIMRSASNLFVIPTSCEVTSTDLILPFDIEMPSSDEHEHAHDHKHDHEHENENENEHKDAQKHEEKAHLDFEVTYVLNCASTINQIDMSLFEHYPSLNELEVLKITENGQSNSMISAQSARVMLK